ncbi:ABC transporter substrate-binding protein [Roseomonas eburnea]|uniref:ABC transporter substrate-binding protein n=1 Tax=Neoroseomonas eburnea TaxID=1346889 RepID=A0A9X9XDM5_9PROT|nr:penicillin-binding protein activator [Neoroseomonas eburnea]MBR0681811.1 ABC transporter substrate-binding protein [Neoroseomonas eburnea]
MTAGPLQEPPRNRIALLLPLTGPQAPLGAAMQQAAELALFERGNRSVDFLPMDTGGTTSGAAAAARRAAGQGARVIVGPLTAAETSAASTPARAARIPILAFTNDAAQSGPGVWTLGVTPAQQVRRAMGAAMAGGAQRFALAAPDDAFGRALATAMRHMTSEWGLPDPVMVMHPVRANGSSVAQDLMGRASGGVDAVLIGSTGALARGVAGGIAAAATPAPRILGHALWAQDATLGQEPALHGALFAAPDPRSRASFDSRYEGAFGERPPRLAGVAYDAAGVAARVVLTPRGQAGPNTGEVFDGVDGPVRLQPEGQVQRGLALFAIEPSGEARMVERAPVPGTAGS